MKDFTLIYCVAEMSPDVSMLTSCPDPLRSKAPVSADWTSEPSVCSHGSVTSWMIGELFQWHENIFGIVWIIFMRLSGEVVSRFVVWNFTVNCWANSSSPGVMILNRVRTLWVPQLRCWMTLLDLVIWRVALVDHIDHKLSDCLRFIIDHWVFD